MAVPLVNSFLSLCLEGLGQDIIRHDLLGGIGVAEILSVTFFSLPDLSANQAIGGKVLTGPDQRI